MSIDSLNVLSSVQAFSSQCSQVISDLAQFTVPQSYTQISNVVVTGMGGSALGARVIASLERQVIKLPIYISTEYHLPNFVNEQTLVIASSYSGNTEETLTSLSEAEARNAKIVILASGGKLAQIAHQKSYPSYIFEPHFNPCGQPRMALGYNLVGLLRIFSACGVLHELPNLNDLVKYLSAQSAQSNTYQQLSQQLVQHIPVIVSSEHLKGAGIAFRNQLNENAKTFAVFNELPELNHHLLEGLSFPSSNPQNLCFVLVDSSHYHPRVTARYRLTQQLLTKQKIPFTTLSLSAPNTLFEAFDLVQAGANVAYYLSQVQNIDPGPIPWVDWFKDELAKIPQN